MEETYLFLLLIFRHLRDKGEDDKMPPIRKKQRGLLLKLQQEKVNATFTLDCFELPHRWEYLANLGYSQKANETGHC